MPLMSSSDFLVLNKVRKHHTTIYSLALKGLMFFEILTSSAKYKETASVIQTEQNSVIFVFVKYILSTMYFYAIINCI